MAKDYGELLAAAKNGNKLTPYERLQMSTYKDARTASTANTNDGGYIDSALRAAKSTGLGMLGGLSYLVGAEDTAKQLQQAAQENARRKEFDTVFDWNYITDPEGALYDVAGGLTSMAMLAPAAFLLPESAAAGAAGVISSGLGRAGLGRLGTWAASEAGKKALQTGVRGAMTAIPESVSEWGNTAQEAAEMGIENPRASTVSDFAKNMAMLPMSNALEYMLLGGKVFNKTGKAGESLAKRIAYAPFRATPPTAANAGQNAIEEFFQQSFSDEALGKPTGSLFDPSSWTPEQRQALQAGGVVGGVLGGVGAGKRALFDTTKPSNQEQPQAEQEEAEDNTTSPDNPLPPNTEVSSIQRMRELQGKIPYEAEDGTNCMRTLGIALAGTPYGGQINVDQAIETAKKQGQLMEPDKYIPRPGDIAVVEDGNHAVMVTENGGTIQNGASHNGVYESDQSPLEMFGKVKYYIRTSDYLNSTSTDTDNIKNTNDYDIIGEGGYTDEALQAGGEPIKNLNSLLAGNGFDTELMGRAEAQDNVLANEINSLQSQQNTIRAGEEAPKFTNTLGTSGTKQSELYPIYNKTEKQSNTLTPTRTQAQAEVDARRAQVAALLDQIAGQKWDNTQKEYGDRRTNNAQQIANIVNAIAAKKWDAAQENTDRVLAEQQEAIRRREGLTVADALKKIAAQKWDKTQKEYDSRKTENAQQLTNIVNMLAAQKWDAAQQDENVKRAKIKEALKIINKHAAREWDKAELQPILQQIWNQPFVPQRQSMYDGALRRNLAALNDVRPEDLPSVEPTPRNSKALDARNFLDITLPNAKRKYKAGERVEVTAAQQNATIAKKKPSLGAKFAIEKLKLDREKRERDQQYREIKQEIIDEISVYPSAKKQLEETQTIKKNVVQSLRDTLQETYDQLAEGMGNGVIDEYVNKETREVEDLTGLKKGAEERKNNSTGYERVRASLNAPWYSDWIKYYKRKPTKTELYNLAEKYYLGDEEIKDIRASWYDGTEETEAERKSRQETLNYLHDYIDACDVVAKEIKNGKNYYKEQQTAESTQGTKTQEEQNAQADKNLITPQDIDALGQKPAANTLDGIIEEMVQQQPKPKAESKPKRVEVKAEGNPATTQEKKGPKSTKGAEAQEEQNIQANQNKEANNEEEIYYDQAVFDELESLRTNKVKVIKEATRDAVNEFKTLLKDKNLTQEKIQQAYIAGDAKISNVVSKAMTDLTDFHQKNRVLMSNYKDWDNAHDSLVNAQKEAYKALHDAEQDAYRKLYGDSKPSQSDNTVNLPEGVTVEVSYNEEKNGVQLKFNKAPGNDVTSKLFQAGFKWSRKNQLWYSLRNNPKAMEIAKQFEGAKEKPIPKITSDMIDIASDGNLANSIFVTDQLRSFREDENAIIEYLQENGWEKEQDSITSQLIYRMQKKVTKETFDFVKGLTGEPIKINGFNDAVASYDEFVKYIDDFKARDKDKQRKIKEAIQSRAAQSSNPKVELVQDGKRIKISFSKAPLKEAKELLIENGFIHPDGENYWHHPKDEQGMKVARMFDPEWVKHHLNPATNKQDITTEQDKLDFKREEMTEAFGKLLGIDNVMSYDDAVKKFGEDRLNEGQVVLHIPNSKLYFIVEKYNEDDAAKHGMKYHVDAFDGKVNYDTNNVFDAKNEDVVAERVRNPKGEVTGSKPVGPSYKNIAKYFEGWTSEWPNKKSAMVLINGEIAKVEQSDKRALKLLLQDNYEEAAKAFEESKKAINTLSTTYETLYTENNKFIHDARHLEMVRGLLKSWAATYNEHLKNFKNGTIDKEKIAKGYEKAYGEKIDAKPTATTFTDNPESLINKDALNNMSLSQLEAINDMFDDGEDRNKAKKIIRNALLETKNNKELEAAARENSLKQFKIAYYDAVDDFLEDNQGKYPFFKKLIEKKRFAEDNMSDAAEEAYRLYRAGMENNNQDVVKSNVEDTAKGGSTNADDNAGLRGVSESGKAGTVSETGKGRNIGGLPSREVQGSDGVLRGNDGTAYGGQSGNTGGLSGKSKTQSNVGSTGERTDQRNDVPQGLTPAQQPNAKAEEVPGHNFTIKSSSDVAGNGKKTKFKGNVAAISLLKKLQAENRMATPSEQKVLAKYIGWGGIQEAFDGNRYPEWAEEAKQLKELLTDEEWKDARDSVKTAFFTPPAVIDGIYKIVQQLGFKGGRVLDPCMGHGNFFGAMPTKLRKNCMLRGVEKNGLAGGMSKQLYQDASVEVIGFENAFLDNNGYDLVISNVPFNRDIHPIDAEFKAYNFNLHNYFFAKALQKVRPGGLIAFITSEETMKSGGAKLREYLSKRADFICAVKLPDTTFKSYADTSVTSDLIILQKREENGKPSKYAQEWLKSQYDYIEIGDGTREYGEINEYFLKNRDMVIGSYARGNWNSVILKGGDLNVGDEIAKIADKLPKGVYKPIKVKNNNNSTQASTVTYLAKGRLQSGSIVVTEQGNVMIRQGENLVPFGNPKAKTYNKDVKCAAAYSRVRDVTKALLEKQLDPNVKDEELDSLRAELNQVYDKFVAGYKALNANNKLLSVDPDYGLVCAIEHYHYDKKNKKATTNKAAIFTTRTVNAIKPATSATSPTDALMLSLANNGRMDLEYMQDLLGGKMTEKEIIDSLGDSVYKDPESESYVLANDYLSGNVREKLERAKLAVQTNKAYSRNVKALEKVIPVNKTEKDVKANLGSAWIPAQDVQQFANELMETTKGEVAFIPATGTWVVDMHYSDSGVKGTQIYGTKDRSFGEILSAALNQKEITIKHKDVVDVKASKLANATVSKVQEEFSKWIWSDKERKERLLNYYNNNFNATVLTEYDGSMLTFPGYSAIAPELKDHQKSAIWRIIQRGTCLIAHCVGAGKTWTMQTSAMELKRLGLIQKPMFTIPNHMVEQFTNEFRQIYPNAKLLVLTSDILPEVGGGTSKNQDIIRQNRAIRKATLSRIATEDWDGIIISHSLFKRIPMSAKAYESYYNEQIEELENALREIDDAKEGNRLTVKELQTKLDRAKEKMQKAMNEVGKDLDTPFDKLGIDQLYVDEADLFKNLAYVSNMGRVSGLSNSNSQRSQDMYIKTQYLMNTHNGRGVVFATGTPISNTIAEMFTMLRYLNPKALKDHGVSFFDNWINTFSKKETTLESKPTGNGYRTVQKFAKFYNMSGLKRMFLEVADVKTQADIDVKIPKLKNGKRTTSELAISKELKDYIAHDIQDRADQITNGQVKPEEDNMLKLTSDLRKASLDMRLVPGFENLPISIAAPKIVAVADNAYKKYVESQDVKGTQLIFCDLSTPKGSSDKELISDSGKVEEEEQDTAQEQQISSSVYSSIGQELIKRGIPKEEIAFIHDAKTDEQKETLFEKVRNGEVRILLGSTSKMGAGTNCQKLIVGLHHVDCPWRPRDIEQREGRALRQGNVNDEVEIFTYVTKESFDQVMWEKVKNKAAMIAQAMNPDLTIDEIEDVSADVLSFAEIQAVASGDPYVARRIKVGHDLDLLRIQYREYTDNKSINKRTIRENKAEIPQLERMLDSVKKDKAKTFSVKGENFKIQLDGKTYTKFGEADEAIKKLIEQPSSIDRVIKGSLGGLDFRIKYVFKGNEYRPSLRNSIEFGYHASKDTYVVEFESEDKAHCYISNAGLRSMIDMVNNGPSAEIDYINNRIAKLQKEIKDASEALKLPFDQEEEYNKLLKEADEIEAHFKAIDESAKIGQDYRKDRNFVTDNGKEYRSMGNTRIVGNRVLLEAMDEKTGEATWVDASSIENTVVQYSVAQAETLRPRAEIEAEIRTAFPNGTITYENGVPVVTLPNGAKFQYSIRKNIIVNAREQKKADSAHGTSGGVIQGFWQKFSGNGVQRLLAVAQNSERGTAFHEAMHAAIDLALTEKEANALRKYYQNKAKEQNRNVDEVIADAYRDWVLARQQKRGTVFGKLWQKIKDFCVRIRSLFDNGAEVQRIMQDVESGKVYERGANNGNGMKQQNAQGEKIQYSVATPKNKIASAFANTERKTRLETAKDFFKEHAKNLYSDMIDKNHILKTFDELTKSTGGLSVYEQAQGLPSTTAGMLKAITMGNVLSIEKANLHLKNVKMKHKVTLAMVLDKINKKAMDEKHNGYLEQNGFDSWANAFGAYLGAKRLLEMGRIAKAQNEPYSYPKGLTENELTQFVSKAPKELAQAADMFYKVNDNVISIMEDAQVFSPELAKVLRTKYRNYCPLLRDFTDTAAADSFFDGLTVGGRSIGNVSIPLKKISINGSERGVLNPLETTLKAYSVMLNRAERNKVGLLAVNRAKATGLKELIEEVPEVIGKDGKAVNAVADPKNCIFTVLVNGKKKAFKTTQELYTPIVGFNLPAANLCFNVAAIAARTLRTGATMSPSFIVRNVLRDTFFAGVSSKNGFIPILDSIRGFMALKTNKELKAEFEAAGVTEFNFFTSKAERIKSIDQMTDEAPKDALSIIKALFEKLEDWSALAESSTRMGEFMRARKNGLTIEEAARAAREVTLDFSRSGNVGEQINRLVPFFNACLQGGDKMYRLFREDFVGTSQKVFQYIILPSLLLFAFNWDKDWYKDLDPDTRNNYWFISKTIRIPKPQEVGVIFGSGVESMLMKAADKDHDAMVNLAGTIKENLIPNIVPTLLLPLLEWQSNYNYFKGRQIVGNKYKNLPDELQYSDYTSEAAKGVGSVLKVSPMKVDNLVRGYTGTMGAFLWSAPDFVTNKAKDAPTKNWYEYYPFRDFTVTDSNLSRPMNEFYDLLERANKQHAGYGKKGQPNTTTQAIRKVGTMLSNYRKEIDKITKSKGLTPDRKRELIDLRKKKMNELAKRTVEKYKDKV